MSQYDVVWDGNNLNAIPNVEVYNHEFNALPNRNIRQNEVARADRSIITSADYTEKPVTVSLEVCAGSRSQTEGRLTFVKSLLQRINAPVRVIQSDSEYEYRATLNAFNIEWDGTTALVEVGATAADPIGYETTVRTILDENLTVGQTSFTRIFGGSFRAQPTFSLNINSVTGGTGGEIQIRNTNTGQGITLSHDFEDNDTVIINAAERQASINGNLVDFAGVFPTFQAGSRGIGYRDNFTGRDIDITATYIRRIV